MTWLWLGLGLGVLTLGAELLVRGAVGLASAMRVSPLVIGLTVVAFGTSAPEFVVSGQSALTGQPEIALGNVLGSNIFNILLILGISALIVPLRVDQQLIRLDVPLMIAVSVTVYGMSRDGKLDRLEGALLFTGLISYTVWSIIKSRQESNPEVVAEYSEEFPERPKATWGYILVQAVILIVGLAMLVAGTVNLSLLLVAATNLRGREGTDTITGAHAAVADALGPWVALLFAIGLLASGLASTSVGAYAGAMIMQGLLRRSFPLLVRRLLTLIPALAVLAAGVDPTRALVLSQVVLSFGLPFALIPLVKLTSDGALMGADVNRRSTTALGWTVAALISLLNVALIYLIVK